MMFIKIFISRLDPFRTKRVERVVNGKEQHKKAGEWVHCVICEDSRS